MGSCLSKPSSKSHKKKNKDASPAQEREDPELLKPWKASQEEKEDAPFVSVVAPSSSPPLLQENQLLSASPLPSPLPGAAAFSESHPPQLPPASPPVQKSSPSPALSPDPATLPIQGQTPMRKKHSGELTLRKPSSPCKSLLHNMPSSPGVKKAYRNEEDDCKFPSLARKQWLSQACVPEIINKGHGGDDSLIVGSKASVGENTQKQLNAEAQTLTLTGTEAISLLSKVSGSAEAPGRTNKACDAKSMAIKNKISAVEAPTLTGKTVSSRTNSLSRDLSPVEPARVKVRPSSPLKRSPSMKDHAGAADGPRLTRSSSGKVSSPNRAGLHAAERHESMKARPLHKQSLSKEFLTDPSADPSVHKRSSSRDSVSEFSAEIIRKPSPPKKTPVVVASSASLSSLDGNRLGTRRPSTPSKENIATHRQEPTSMARGGRIPAQRSLSAAVHEPDNSTAGNNNRNVKRKEKSPLRRTCNGMASLHSSTRISDRNADLSINSDTTAVGQFDLLGKDVAARTRKSSSRIPLKEISDNSIKLTSTKQGAKEMNGGPVKARDEFPVQKGNSKEETAQGFEALEKADEKAILNMASNLNDYVKDPLEVKAENLVMGGKSVLSAFKALEEYRLKYSNITLESRNATGEDVWYTRQHPHATTDKETFSQHLQGSDVEKALPNSDPLQQAHDLPRSRSTKKSCEQFFFPDVHSLLMSENEGMQLEAGMTGMTMPASISKACSILRAVADLNMGGTPMYPKRKEVQDEIERPNLLSFQFGEGDSHRVTLS